jgi:hypothetical protein
MRSSWQPLAGDRSRLTNSRCTQLASFETDAGQGAESCLYACAGTQPAALVAPRDRGGRCSWTKPAATRPGRPSAAAYLRNPLVIVRVNARPMSDGRCWSFAERVRTLEVADRQVTGSDSACRDPVACLVGPATHVTDGSAYRSAHGPAVDGAHRRGSRADGLDDLGPVGALQRDGVDPEVGAPRAGATSPPPGRASSARSCFHDTRTYK